VFVLFPKTRRRCGQACLTDVAVADAPNVISMLITVIGQLSCYFSSRPIAERRADCTVGSRLAGPRAPERFLGTRCLAIGWPAGIIRNLFGLTMSDLGPFRAVRADALRIPEMEETAYARAAELIVKGAIRGLRIVEVPVSYHLRIGQIEN